VHTKHTTKKKPVIFRRASLFLSIDNILLRTTTTHGCVVHAHTAHATSFHHGHHARTTILDHLAAVSVPAGAHDAHAILGHFDLAHAHHHIAGHHGHAVHHHLKTYHAAA